MKKQIIRFSPVQNAKVIAALYFVMSIPFVLLYMVLPGVALPWWVFILMPVVYLVIGFIFSLIGAWIYNLVAARVGGFEFTTVEVSGDHAV